MRPELPRFSFVKGSSGPAAGWGTSVTATAPSWREHAGFESACRFFVQWAADNSYRPDRRTDFARGSLHGPLGVQQTLALQHGLPNFIGQIRVRPKECLRIFSTLPKPRTLVVVPRAGLLDNIGKGRKVQQIALVADAAVEHDVELGVAEGGRNLVLHHPRAGAIADGDFALLDRPRAAHVDADG